MPRPRNKDAEGLALVCKGVRNDQQLRPLNSLAYTAGHTTHLAHEREHLSSFKLFDNATGSPNYKGFSTEGKGKRVFIPAHSHDNIKSPQRQQWNEAIGREVASP